MTLGGNTPDVVELSSGMQQVLRRSMQWRIWRGNRLTAALEPGRSWPVTAGGGAGA